MTSIPVRTPLIQTDAMRIDQMNAHRIIAHSLNVLRLRRKAEASHSPLDRRDWLLARDEQDDMLDGVAGRFKADPVACVEEWPRLPSDLITNGGDL